MNTQQTPSRLALWVGLMRPHTLFSGLIPVLLAVSYALSAGHSVEPLLAILLALVAVSAQIASNVANDLFDYRRGADTSARKGFTRPLSLGLLSEREVVVALGLSLLVLVASGLTLVALSSWWLVLVALSVVLGLFAYSAGPYPLAYHGWGDVAVLVFFGYLPIIVSYYVLTGSWGEAELWLMASSVGLSSVNVLLVNNYRDYEEDLSAGKRTLVVRLGRDFAPRMYLSCGLLSILLLYPYYSAWGILILTATYGVAMLRTYRHLTTHSGRELNATLSRTARNVAILALAIIAMLVLR